MRASFLASVLATCLFAGRAQAKAIFAHYMVGTVTEEHAHKDIDDAQAIGIDGFALNIGDPTQPFVTEALSHLFGYAASKGFSLYINMDLYASGAACEAGRNCCNGPMDYYPLFKEYLGSSAWYKGPNSFPLISTFSSGKFQQDTWKAWRQSLANQMYFIPVLDDTQGYYQSATAWHSYWGDVLEGVASWESAWPPAAGGMQIGDVSPDITVLNGMRARHKGYMIPLSTLQFKDSFGADVYRSGDLNLPIRMKNILAMNPQPEFVQLITWNDGPESHYIGNLWPESSSSTPYASPLTQPHTAWQPLISAFINAWKKSSPMSPPSDIPAIGALWFNPILKTASCSSPKPAGFETASDQLNWAVVVSEGADGMSVEVSSGCQILKSQGLNEGLNFGAAVGVKPGKQRLTVKDAQGKTISVASSGAGDIADSCPGGSYNFNPIVVGLSADAGDAC